MSDIVDHVFPPSDAQSSSPSVALDFSSFTYWRESLPNVRDITEDENETISNEAVLERSDSVESTTTATSEKSSASDTTLQLEINEVMDGN
jgi:hypothetical protein